MQLFRSPWLQPPPHPAVASAALRGDFGPRYGVRVDPATPGASTASTAAVAALSDAMLEAIVAREQEREYRHPAPRARPRHDGEAAILSRAASPARR